MTVGRVVGAVVRGRLEVILLDHLIAVDVPANHEGHEDADHEQGESEAELFRLRPIGAG